MGKFIVAWTNTWAQRIAAAGGTPASMLPREDASVEKVVVEYVLVLSADIL